MKDLRKMIDGYACKMRYMDEHIGMSLDALKEEGVYDDDLAIVIIADYGENQGELGVYGEHATADNITCRIAMVVKWPRCKKGYVDRGGYI